MKRKVNISKLVRAILAFNGVQLFLVAILLTAQFRYGFFGPVSLLVLVAGSGAVVSMLGALALQRAYAKSVEQEDLLRSMESFNDTLRAQRHDFSNHIQVVYSLLQMREYGEAENYLGKVSSAIKAANANIKTAQPAVNALLKAKQLFCENAQIALELDVKTKMEQLPLEVWEFCRVLGNLIDNAVEALGTVEKPDKYIRVSFYEWQGEFVTTVANNGPKINEELHTKIFLPDFSTKGQSRGMGLFNVAQIIGDCNGEVLLNSDDKETSFSVCIPIESGKTTFEDV